MQLNLNTIINLRGLREQSHKFALDNKIGMKQCYTRGCEIFTPIQHALSRLDVLMEIRYQNAFSGEGQINEPVTFVR